MKPQSTAIAPRRPASMRTQRVLVTGASGFIGSHLAERLLDQGHTLSYLARKPDRLPELFRKAGRVVQGDLSDPSRLDAAVAEVDVVFHLAGLTQAPRAGAFYETNSRGVARVAAACVRRTTPPVLVLVSSLAAAGPSLDGQLRREGESSRPVSHYGRSKRAGELAVARHAARMPISIVRPPIVFGPRDRLLLPAYAMVQRTGLHVIPGFARRRFSWVHVDDLVAALHSIGFCGERLPALLATAQENGGGQGMYYVAHEDLRTYHQLGTMLGHALGRGRTVGLQVPDCLLWLIAGAGDAAARLTGKPAALSWDKVREVTAGEWICSAEKLRTTLRWRSSADLQQQFDATARWYRDQGWLG